MKKKLLISFSGGETSAFMTQWLLANKRDAYEMIVVFANTGEENEATLQFVDQCDRYFGLNVAWLEYDHLAFRVVNFNTASRNGAPFERMIQKFGIPNRNTPHCSRELKQRTIRRFMASIGWRGYYTAIGIRNDEIDRISENRIKERLLYPLVQLIPTSKPGVNKYWEGMPFRLQLKGYEGNCKACWKKSFRKLTTIASESPAAFDFFEKMEKVYGQYIPQSRQKNKKLPDKVNFFRENMTVMDIKKMSESYFEKAQDDSVSTIEFKQLTLDLDTSNGCIESCEVF